MVAGTPADQTGTLSTGCANPPVITRFGGESRTGSVRNGSSFPSLTTQQIAVDAHEAPAHGEAPEP